MKKLLVLFNGTHNPMHVIRFMLALAKEHGLLLHCIYLHNEPDRKNSYPFPNDLNLTEEEISTETVQDERAALVADNILFVQDECAVAGVGCEVDKDVSFKDFIHRTSTADCLVVDAKIDLDRFDLTDLLTGVHCPVMLIAETAAKIEHLVFAYDGGEGSKHAVRKFTELFPSLPAVKTHVVSINKKETDKAFIAEHLVSYGDVQTHHLEGNEREEMVTFLRQYPDNALVVMGAFGRSALSRIFHESLGSTVLNETRLSLFIAHK